MRGLLFTIVFSVAGAFATQDIARAEAAIPTAAATEPESARGTVENATNAAMVPAPEVAPEAAVALTFTPSSLDLGRHLQKQSIQKLVTVRNNSLDTLEISKVFADCGCTIAQLGNDVLAPGASTTLSVIFETRGYLGEIRRTVTLNTSAGVFTLPLSITIAQHKDWDITPMPIAMRPSFSDRPAKLDVVVRPRSVTKLATLTTASASVPWLEVAVARPANGAQTITLLKTTEASPATHTVFVTLKSATTEDEPLVLQVIVPVAATLSATPYPIALDASKVGEEVSTTFRVLGWNEATPPVAHSDTARVEYVREISGEHEYRLTYKSTETGESVGSVQILRGKKIELEIPFIQRAEKSKKAATPASP